MKIVYLAFWDAYRKSGVLKKIKEQVDSWKQVGMSVEPLIVSTKCSSEEPIYESLGSPVCSTFFTWAPEGTALAMLARMASLHKVKDLIVKYQPDFLYYRVGIGFPGLTSLFREIPVVMEINTNDLAESMFWSLLRRQLNKRMRERVLGCSKGFTFMTNELRKMYSSWCKKPSLIYSNGFNYTFPFDGVSRGKDAVFVGTPGYAWHGVDKIKYLAEIVPWKRIHIVGPSKEFELPNVVWHGMLFGQGLEQIYKECDIAIGTLALHRKNMAEACPLKTREYINYDLPVIAAYEDSDFNGEEYFIKLENTEAYKEVWNKEKIIEAMTNPPRIINKEKIKKRYSWHGKAYALKKFYESLLEEG